MCNVEKVGIKVDWLNSSYLYESNVDFYASLRSSGALFVCLAFSSIVRSSEASKREIYDTTEGANGHIDRLNT